MGFVQSDIILTIKGFLEYKINMLTVLSKQLLHRLSSCTHILYQLKSKFIWTYYINTKTHSIQISILLPLLKKIKRPACIKGKQLVLYNNSRKTDNDCYY